MPPALTGTVLTSTAPSTTIGWMSMPSLGVDVIFLAQIRLPVVASRATTPVEPRSVKTRPLSTATPNGPMLGPVGSLAQRTVPVTWSSAVTRPLLSPTYTVPSTTIGTVVKPPSIVASQAGRSVETLEEAIREPLAARELSRS